MTPTATQVATFAGRADDAEFVSAAGSALPVVTAMVSAFTRGRGFVTVSIGGGEFQVIPDAAIAAVILSSAARLASNPEHIIAEQIGDYMVRPGVFAGWTLPELAILNGYRVRAR